MDAGISMVREHVAITFWFFFCSLRNCVGSSSLFKKRKEKKMSKIVHVSFSLQALVAGTGTDQAEQGATPECTPNSFATVFVLFFLPILFLLRPSSKSYVSYVYNQYVEEQKKK